MSVPNWYTGRTVFVTGGTGFMGKVLLEKLLFSCPDVGTIYILARVTSKSTLEKRLDDLRNCPVNTSLLPLLCRFCQP